MMTVQVILLVCLLENVSTHVMHSLVVSMLIVKLKIMLLGAAATQVMPRDPRETVYLCVRASCVVPTPTVLWHVMVPHASVNQVPVEILSQVVTVCQTSVPLPFPARTHRCV